MTASDAFPALTPDQTERLRAVGTEEDVAAGDFLFREGDAGYDFFAILAGEVQVYMEARACDAATAVVVGGGNSAGQAAMFLSERFAHVRLLPRGGDLGKSMSHYLTSRIEAAPRIEVRRYT